ncbi:MAG: prepilin-type N-terminal cleavage/methylation domain-containing protein [Planctomycetota bacterium]|nr:prepilin-type N-terminal cleavage/methylation domain-containing protein [Planctomycetota bacterium]
MGSRRRGFTLMEMLVVISIITILSGLVLGAMAIVRQRSKEHATLLTLQLLDAALQRYEQDYQDYPPSEGDQEGIRGSENLLRMLLSEKKEGPYIRSNDVRMCDANRNGELEIADAWNKPIRYLHHRDYHGTSPNKHTYRLISGGPNGLYEEGAKGSDDIVNWNKARPDQ